MMLLGWRKHYSAHTCCHGGRTFTNRRDPTVSGSSAAPVTRNVSPEQMDRQPCPLGAYTPGVGGRIHKSTHSTLARTVCSGATFSREAERCRDPVQGALTPEGGGGLLGSGCDHPGQRSQPVPQGTMTNRADDKCSHSGQTLKEKLLGRPTVRCGCERGQPGGPQDSDRADRTQAGRSRSGWFQRFSGICPLAVGKQ